MSEWKDKGSWGQVLNAGNHGDGANIRHVGPPLSSGGREWSLLMCVWVESEEQGKALAEKVLKSVTEGNL